MARLGKRERLAKRDLIKRNLNGAAQVEKQVRRDPKTGHIFVATQRQATRDCASSLMGKAYHGFRNPQNYRGSEGKTKRYKVWSNA